MKEPGLFMKLPYMSLESRNTKVPLPFATAAIALSLSYLFPAQIGSVTGTLVGFFIGIVLLYFAAQRTSETVDHFVCPACGSSVHLRDGHPYAVERPSRRHAAQGK